MESRNIKNQCNLFDFVCCITKQGGQIAKSCLTGIFCLLLSSYSFGASTFQGHELLKSEGGLTLLFHFDRAIQYTHEYQSGKRRYRLEVQGARSLTLKGRQDLDHLLAVSFFLRNKKGALEILLYQRGFPPIDFRTIGDGKTLRVHLKNPYPLRAQLDPGGEKYVVCIDPGHGGHDPGAQGLMAEKDMNLLVAKTLKEVLNEFPGISAFLTRDKDYKIKLEDRPKISDRAQADVFISLHMNSSTPPTRGFEIYYLSEEGADENVDNHLSELEPETRSPEEEIRFLVNQDLVQKIILDIKQGENVNSSSVLAHSIGTEMKLIPGSRFRGVHRDAFVVLKTVNTPSVLIELGFITNKRDVNTYLSYKGRRTVAEKIAQGIRNFILEQNLLPKGRKLASDVSEQVLDYINSASPLKPTEILRSKPKWPREIAYHEVQPGDTFNKIARLYNIPTSRLISANPGTQPSAIPVGKRLKIPLQK